MTGTDAAPKSYIRCHNHGTDTYCLVPSGGGEVQVINAEATITGNTNSEESGKKDANVTAVSDCHVSSSSLYCSAESTVYYAQTSVTATEDIPAQFTGCHNHGDDLYENLNLLENI
ncbi:hypothetical protein CEP54_016170 [Fusarium duplospermum]|uniref:Uncharacterized protein n=1 Tax=Fusarium duplospermum TaxID=1325734 RepID=A0A428NHC4_9HYPO|nr:hypothetical protein CEP54_016170 [Fusarium duplospermum]